jgi:peptide/nickel transport system substrate-binding protein
LEANPDYWDGRPYLDKAIFRCIPDNSVRFLELKTGNIDICQFPNPEDIDLAKKDASLKLVSQPGMNIGYLSFNHTKPLWQDKLIRQAFAYGINKKAIVDNIYYGLGQTAKNTIPPNLWGYNDDIQDYPYDPEKAKELLAQAKFSEKLKEAGQEKITLWSMPVPRPYNPNGMKVGEAMQADLKKVGVDVELVTFEWGTYLKKQRTQPPDMDLFQLGWTGDNGDPDNFLLILLDGIADPNVRTQWKNEEYHNTIIKAKTTIDMKERTKLYHKAQELIHEEVPMINVAHSLVVWPMKKRVENFKLHPTASVRLHKVWVK